MREESRLHLDMLTSEAFALGCRFKNKKHESK